MIPPHKKRLIADLLGDPITQMMMRADRVDQRAIARELHSLAWRIEHTAAPQSAAKRDCWSLWSRRAATSKSNSIDCGAGCA